MRVSVPENIQNSAVGRLLFLEKFFSTVDFSGGEGVSMGFERLDRLSLPRRTRRASSTAASVAGKARARPELENSQPRLKADKDRKFIIESHFACRKSLM
jgi:hypothetical protein